jgi:hypothetical protein
MAFIIQSGGPSGMALAAVILACLVITAVLLRVGVSAARLLLRWAAGLGRAPISSQSDTVSPADSRHSDDASPSSAAALKALLSQGDFKSLPGEFAAALERRINELMGLIVDAHAALSAGGEDALNTAARKIVDGRHLLGLEWRKYLASSAAAARAGAQVLEAFRKDAAPLVSEVARLLAARPPAEIVPQEEGFVLGCAACKESAITFRPSKTGFCARNISNVNQTICWEGETGKRLGELLTAGGTRALLGYFAAREGAGCPAYCPSCDRVYCRGHYAVSEEWSGSWYSAGYVTCVLGHEREYE